MSESVCLFVPNYSEMTEPEELKFWGMIPLGMQKALGQNTSGFVKPLAGKMKISARWLYGM